MAFCHKCGAQNEPDAVYCEECGSRLLTAGQPTDAGAAASAEPPAPVPSGDAGIAVPPPAVPTEPRRVPWRLLGALLLVAALVAGGVGIYLAVSGGDDEGKPLAGGEKTATAVEEEASPTVKATPKPKVTPKPTVPSRKTPTRPPKATPTEEDTQPPAVRHEAQVKAVTAWVEEYGEQYAGDCDTADVETDAGKYCSTLWEDRGDSAIYAIGLTFSEYSFWLLLERVDNDWVASDWADVVAEEMTPPW